MLPPPLKSKQYKPIETFDISQKAQALIVWEEKIADCHLREWKERVNPAGSQIAHNRGRAEVSLLAPLLCQLQKQ